MLVGMFKDPTAQNLWPLAVATLAVTALIAASLGALCGSLLLLLWRMISGGRNAT